MFSQLLTAGRESFAGSLQIDHVRHRILGCSGDGGGGVGGRSVQLLVAGRDRGDLDPPFQASRVLFVSSVSEGHLVQV